MNLFEIMTFPNCLVKKKSIITFEEKYVRSTCKRCPALRDQARPSALRPVHSELLHHACARRVGVRRGTVPVLDDAVLRALRAAYLDLARGTREELHIPGVIVEHAGCYSENTPAKTGIRVPY